jgi:hypothetical protein
MRISFVCGSFEPGRDGVGDYVAQFVRALHSRGHELQVIAAADKYARGSAVEWFGSAEVVRLPAERWARGEIEPLLRALRRFGPDWASLQMVLYAYERRGLLLRSPARLAQLASLARQSHVMFHEVWIGESVGCTLRQRAIGWTQKQLLVRAMQSWAPRVVHTSNPTYRELLRRAGIAAQLLPLPGNIPIVAGHDSASARTWLLRRIGLADADRQLLLAGVFGSIHGAFAEAQWLAPLREACVAGGRRLVLVQLGRAGPRGASLWQEVRAAAGAGVRLAELGELPADEVSIALQGLDLGVATTPWGLIGKSGSVASMLEHGLPVCVPCDDVQLLVGDTPEPLASPLLQRCDDSFLALVRGGRLARRPPAAEPRSYERFAADLVNARAGAIRTRRRRDAT